MDILDRIKTIEESGCLSTTEIMNLRTNPQIYFDKWAIEYKKEYKDEDLDMNTQLSVDYTELYVLYLLNKGNRTQDEINYLLKFKNAFLKELSSNKVQYISSLILNDETVKRLFNDKEKEIVKKYKRDVKAAVVTIYDKLQNKQSITKNEEAIFFKYIGRVDFAKKTKIKEMRDFVVRSNIGNRRNYSTFEKQFLCRYLAINKCIDKKIPIIIPYVTSTDLYGKKTSWNGLHTGFSKGSIVQISQDFLRSNGFVEVDKHGLAHVVFHEYEHWNQYFNTSKNYLNSTTYIYAKSRILRHGLSKTNFDEYMRNYIYKESERFANIKAYVETSVLVRELIGRNRISDYLYSKAFETRAALTRGVQRDENGNLFYIGDFNIEQLERILKANPQYLNQYPIMANFFNKDGSMRSFKDLISLYTPYSIGSNYDAMDAFEEILEYHVLHDGLKKIDIRSMDREDVLSLLIVLQNSLENQIRACKNMLDSYPDFEVVPREGEKEENIEKRRNAAKKQIELTNYLFKRRAQVIKELMDFAYRNKPAIDRYCDWNADRRFKGDPNARFTRFNMVFYGYNGLETIKTRIVDNPNVVKGGLASDIEDISNYGRRFK